MTMRRFSYPILAAALILCATAGGQADPPNAEPVAAEPQAPAPPPAPAAPGATREGPASAGVPGIPGFSLSPGAPRFPQQLNTSLENVIQGAVSASPEVRVAEAQLREAEAKLQQARIEAVQKAIEAYQGRMKAEETSQTMRELLKQGKIVARKPGEEAPSDLYAMKRLAEAEAEVAKYDARLRGLAGSTASARAEGGPFSAKRHPADSRSRVQEERPSIDSVQGGIAEQLNSPVSLEFEGRPLAGITDYLSEYFGVNMIVDASLGPEYVIPYVRLDDVPLKDALLAIADQSGDLCFLIRSYGIFATTRQNAETLSGPSIPDTVPYYVPVKGGTAASGFSAVGSDIADAVTSAVSGVMEGVEEALSEAAKESKPEADEKPGESAPTAPAEPQQPEPAPSQQR